MANNLLTVHCRGVGEWSTKLKREKTPKTTTAHVLKVLNLLAPTEALFLMMHHNWSAPTFSDFEQQCQIANIWYGVFSICPIYINLLFD